MRWRLLFATDAPIGSLWQSSCDEMWAVAYRWRDANSVLPARRELWRFTDCSGDVEWDGREGSECNQKHSFVCENYVALQPIETGLYLAGSGLMHCQILDNAIRNFGSHSSETFLDRLSDNQRLAFLLTGIIWWCLQTRLMLIWETVWTRTKFRDSPTRKTSCKSWPL
jgi:hypothetical protein